MAPEPGTRASLWLPVILYMAAIFYVSSLSSPPSPPRISDKWIHLLEYAVLGALIARALAGGLSRRVTLTTALTAIAITVMYGVSDEIHQMFVSSRTADAWDLLADAVGGTAGTAACAAWSIISTSRAPHDL